MYHTRSRLRREPRLRDQKEVEKLRRWGNHGFLQLLFLTENSHRVQQGGAMTCTARRLEFAYNGQPLNHRNATEPATCRKLLDFSGTTRNVGITRCSLDFADASAHLCISRDLLDLSCHDVGEARGHRGGAHVGRVEKNRAARSVGGSRSVRKRTSTTTGADRRWP